MIKEWVKLPPDRVPGSLSKNSPSHQVCCSKGHHIPLSAKMAWKTTQQSSPTLEFLKFMNKSALQIGCTSRNSTSTNHDTKKHIGSEPSREEDKRSYYCYQLSHRGWNANNKFLNIADTNRHCTLKVLMVFSVDSQHKISLWSTQEWRFQTLSEHPVAALIKYQIAVNPTTNMWP